MTRLLYFDEESNRPFIETINPPIKPSIGETVFIAGEYFTVKNVVWTFKDNDTIVQIHLK